MNLEDQCCSLELSMKLKELGIEKESLFCYQPIENNPPSVWPRNFNLNEFCKPSQDERIASFTASELTEMLPHGITLKEGEPFNSFRLNITKSLMVDNINDPALMIIYDFYIVNYECDSTECTGENAWFKRQLFNHNISDKNLCNALAKTLIKIKEEKYNET